MGMSGREWGVSGLSVQIYINKQRCISLRQRLERVRRGVQHEIWGFDVLHMVVVIIYI